MERIKKLRITCLESMLDDFVKTGEAIERGEKVKPIKGAKVYFTSFEALRKVLTPKRLNSCTRSRRKSLNRSMSLREWRSVILRTFPMT